MPKLEYVQPKKLNPADELRALLSSLEDRQVSLKSMNSAEALQLLQDLDQVEAFSAHLETAGLNLLPERGRFETLQARLMRSAVLLLKALGGPAALAQHRPSPLPAPERWWWYIDASVGAQQRRRWRNGVIVLVIALLLVGGAVWAFKTILAPSPEVVARLEAEDSAFAAVDQDNYQAALAAVEAGLAKVPDDPRLILLAGILQEYLGQKAEAARMLSKAEAAFDSPLNFQLFRSQMELRLNQPVKAEQSARAALQIDQNSPGAWLLLAQALEIQGKLAEAASAYQQAGQLAFENGDNEIVVLARLAMARLGSVPQ